MRALASLPPTKPPGGIRSARTSPRASWTVESCLSNSDRRAANCSLAIGSLAGPMATSMVSQWRRDVNPAASRLTTS